MSVTRSAIRHLASTEERASRTISVNAHLDGVVVHVPKLFAPILASTDFAFYPTNASVILVGLEPHAMLPFVNLLVPLVITHLAVPAAVPVSQETCAMSVFFVLAL